MVRHWWQSERGSQIVQLALVVPIMLLLLYGYFEVWRVMQARDALQEGVFQAVLYFSTYGYDEPAKALRPEAWDVAQEIIAENVRGTGIVDEEDLAGLELYITYDPAKMECDDLFTVEAVLPLTLHFTPLARKMTLRERRVGTYQCEPPPFDLEVQWPLDGYVGCPGEVRFYPNCYTSPVRIQVRVKSNGSLHYESPWFAAPCAQLVVHVFPPVPSGGWEITVCARGARSELPVCAKAVSGSCP